MRMWNVDPGLMCRRHLLGEHVEMHMFAGCLLRGKSIKGFLDKGLVEVEHVTRRHDELAVEMQRRGFRHISPLVEDYPSFAAGCVDSDANLRELGRRCPDCALRISAARTNQSSGGRKST